MLTALNIRNFVIVDKLELDFQNGFTAMTGETGAGKSILFDALQQLFGARSDVGTIREGNEKSDISATFTVGEDAKHWLKEEDFFDDENENEVTIRRTLDANGRTKAWINGISATLSQLKDFSRFLVLVHGQHAHQSLLHKGAQLKILDNYGKLFPQAKAVEECWNRWRKAHAKLEEAKAAQEKSQTEREQLSWFLEGISDLEPQEGEWEKINEEHDYLSNYTSVVESCEAARAGLTEGDPNALELVDNVLGELESVSDIDPELAEALSKLTDAREIISDVSSMVEHKLSRMDFDEEKYDELDERLNAFMSLARKHRLDPACLYEEGLKAQAKLAELEKGSDIPALKAAEEAAKKEYMKEAEKLSKERKEAAEKMSREITEVMQTLAMAGGSLEVALMPVPSPSQHGLEDCEFLVAGHAGVARRPLSKIASGGELARISLAIAVTDSSAALVDTLIFDEVDTGIGGGVAEVVGKLLKKLGGKQQILCVTHLPQVASCADEQFQITKIQKDLISPPHSEVKRLSREERITEIARMLGGLKLTETTLKHAKEMLDA